ncbi:hypothetical protein FPOAC2_05729 [Fusarium poae]
MATFNRFPDLPAELRVQIWKLVIREDRPGVHIYNRYGPRFMISKQCCSDTFAEPLPLHYFNSVKKDAPRKNVSTYLIDGGLWTACKESRFIMENHFRQSEWVDSLSIPKEERDSREREIPEETKLKIPSTGKFFGGPLHNLTVFPNRDLFVLQVDCLDRVDWDNIGIESSLGWGLLGCSGINHIGIEFNPDWWDSENGRWDWEVLYTLTDAAHNVFPLYKIWIVDHGLKRRKDAPAFEERSDVYYHLNAFYTSDRKLLEVDPQHPGPWTDLRTGLTPDAYPREDNKSSLSFVEHLVSDIEHDRHLEFDENPRRDPYPCCIGILGWDDL